MKTASEPAGTIDTVTAMAVKFRRGLRLFTSVDDQPRRVERPT